MADELRFAFFRLLPFLRKHWKNLDVARRDGRVTIYELYLAREKFRAEGREVWQNLVDDAIDRYPALCSAYSDTSTYLQELEKGISLRDLDAYERNVVDEATRQ